MELFSTLPSFFVLATGTPYPQPRGKVVEIASVHPEIPCRSGPVAMVSCHCAKDEVFLEILHQFAESPPFWNQGGFFQGLRQTGVGGCSCEVSAQMQGGDDHGLSSEYPGTCLEDRSREHVFKLSNVARPAVALKQSQRIGTQPNRPKPQPPLCRFTKVAGEQRDILTPLAQGRNATSHPPIVSETPHAARAGAELLKDKHLAGERGRLETLHFPFLYHTKKLWLNGKRELAYLIQKKCSAIGHFELARSIADGSCEGSLGKGHLRENARASGPYSSWHPPCIKEEHAMMDRPSKVLLFSFIILLTGG